MITVAGTVALQKVVRMMTSSPLPSVVLAVVANICAGGGDGCCGDGDCSDKCYGDCGDGSDCDACGLGNLYSWW